MKNDLIVKQANKLIESVYRMDANEQKVILLATQLVNQMEREGQQFTAETEIVIAAHQYAQSFGIARSSAFEILCETKNTIYEKTFEIDYIDAHGVVKQTESRWIHRKGETSAKSEISLFFAPAVIPYIYLVKDEFTLMDLREVGRLTSKYAIRLYKLLMKWRNAKYQPTFEYEELREILGLESGEYQIKADFKKRVLDVAVDQLNKGTGFVKLKYEGLKKGKVITHFKFVYEVYDNSTMNITPIQAKIAIESDNDETTNPTKQTPAKAKTARKKVIYDESNDYGYTNHIVTEQQALRFSALIIKALTEDHPEVQYLRERAGKGHYFPEFKENMLIDLMAGNVTPYARALRHLGYVQHKSS